MHKIWEEKKREFRELCQANPEFDTVGKAMRMYEPMEAKVRRCLKIGLDNIIDNASQETNGPSTNGRIKEEPMDACVVELEPMEASLKIEEDPNLLKERWDLGFFSLYMF